VWIFTINVWTHLHVEASWFSVELRRPPYRTGIYSEENRRGEWGYSVIRYTHNSHVRENKPINIAPISWLWLRHIVLDYQNNIKIINNNATHTLTDNRLTRTHKCLTEIRTQLQIQVNRTVRSGRFLCYKNLLNLTTNQFIAWCLLLNSVYLFTQTKLEQNIITICKLPYLTLNNTKYVLKSVGLSVGDPNVRVRHSALDRCSHFKYILRKCFLFSVNVFLYKLLVSSYSCTRWWLNEKTKYIACFVQWKTLSENVIVINRLCVD